MFHKIVIQNLGHVYAIKVFDVYLKFAFKWVSQLGLLSL